MHKYVLKRLLMLIPVIIGVTFVVFFILNLAPGDPAAIILGDQATAEALAMKREELGLNDPIFVRYFHYMRDLLHGSLGVSYKTVFRCGIKWSSACRTLQFLLVQVFW